MKNNPTANVVRAINVIFETTILIKPICVRKTLSAPDDLTPAQKSI
jgi:hypothetical protein